MKLRSSVVILVAFLLLGGVLVYLRARQAPLAQTAGAPVASSAPSAEPAPAAKTVLTFLYSSEKQDWLVEAVADFQKAHPDVDVQLQAQGSLEAVRSLLAGERAPVLWSPADSLAVNLFTTQWKLAKGRDPLVHDGSRWPRSLLLTPLVFVAWESRAKVLLGTSTELTWDRLSRAVASTKGWAGLGGNPTWAFVKFGHTDPSKSNSGLQTLVLMAYGFYDRQSGLTVPDVTASPFQNFLKALETGRRAQDFAAWSTEPFVENFIRQGPSLYDVVAVYESTAIAEIPRAAGRWEGLRIFYPSVDMWSDHPVCLLAGDWVSQAQKRAAETLVDYLMSQPVQQRALAHGFRPGNLDVALVNDDPNNPFNRYRAAGVRIDLPRMASSPDGQVLEALLQSYQRNTSN
jgi:hypothetical protein